MADVILGAFQSGEAIAGLITLTVRIIDYCKRLVRAETSAQRILHRIEGFKNVLESLKVALQKPGLPILERVSQEERAQLAGSINSAVEGCEHILKNIDSLCGSLFNGSDANRLQNVNAGRKFLDRRADLNELLSHLEGQKITLLIAFGVLGFHDQHRTSQQDDSAKLTVHINYGNEYFRNSLPPSQPPHTLTHHRLSLLDDDEVSRDTKQTLDNLLSVQDVARSVLDRVARSQRNAGRRDSRAGWLIEEVENRTTTSALASPGLPPDVNSTADDDAELDVLHVGIATRREVKSVTNARTLDYFIKVCIDSALNSKNESNYHLAERYLEKAIAYSEQREQLDNGTPFSQRIEFLEELADICNKVYNWTAAITILKRLLPDTSPVDREYNAETDRDMVRYARQSQLLANVLFDKCCMMVQLSDKVLEEALSRANEAWEIWSKLRASRTLTQNECAFWLRCAKLLEQIWQNSGEFEEATFYDQARLLQTINGPSSGMVSNTASRRTSLADRGRNTIVRAGSGRRRISVYEEAKLAVRTSNAEALQQLFRRPSDVPILVDEKFTDGATILHYAAYKGNQPMVLTLLRMGANVNVQDAHQETALVKAVKKDRVDTVNTLLQWQPGVLNLGLRCSGGQSVLHCAVRHSGIEVMRHLLNADRGLIHLKDHDGRTPLHYCADYGDLEKVGFLLDYEPDCAMEDKRKKTPARLALNTADAKHQEIFHLLMRHHAAQNPSLSVSAVAAALVNQKHTTKREDETLGYFLALYKQRQKTASSSSTPAPDSSPPSSSSADKGKGKGKGKAWPLSFGRR